MAHFREFAKRRLSLWLSPKEANRSWELYGTPAPVDEAVVASGVGVGRGAVSGAQLHPNRVVRMAVVVVLFPRGGGLRLRRGVVVAALGCFWPRICPDPLRAKTTLTQVRT